MLRALTIDYRWRNGMKYPSFNNCLYFVRVPQVQIGGSIDHWTKTFFFFFWRQQYKKNSKSTRKSQRFETIANMRSLWNFKGIIIRGQLAFSANQSKVVLWNTRNIETLFVRPISCQLHRGNDANTFDHQNDDRQWG